MKEIGEEDNKGRRCHLTFDHLNHPNTCHLRLFLYSVISITNVQHCSSGLETYKYYIFYSCIFCCNGISRRSKNDKL